MTFNPLVRKHASESNAGGTEAGRERHRPSRVWRNILLIVVGVLLVVRFIGSPIACSFVNRQLSELPAFIGRVDEVHLSIWRGAVVAENFVLYERGREDEPPVVLLKHATVTLSVGALFTGKLGASVVVDGADFHVVNRTPAPDDPEEEERADAAALAAKEDVQRWQDVFRDSFPMKLTRLEVIDAKVRYVDPTKNPAVDVTVESLNVVATGLQNRPKANGDPLPTKIEVHGVTTGNGKLRASIRIDPIAEQPRFEGSFELRELSLPAVNNFLLAYANADVSRGTFEVFTEIKAQDGAYDGYVKPLFRDLDFRTASDRDKNAAQLFIKKVVTVVVSALENEETEQVATKAPFSGNFADNEVDIWSTIATLFRNAFVQALRGGFEGETPRE